MATAPRAATRFKPFAPAWWCRNGHAQTMWASAVRPAPAPAGCRRERWKTPDGDFLDLDHVPAQTGAPILLILHGLEGSSDTTHVRSFLRAAHRRRWRAIALNFRSCSGEPNRMRQAYHGGATADLRWVLERLAARHPHTPICCVGLSLGGNVLLKYLGEQGEAAGPLAAGAAISSPYDLAASALAFEAGGFNRLYMRRLVRSLKAKTLAKLAQHPGLLDRKQLEAVKTIREFDQVVTAPLNGFASAEDYWAASSCRQFLEAIRRPTLLINALDDPLVPAAGLPRDEVARNPWLTALFPEAGGHTGFISGTQPAKPVRWAEEAVVTFFATHLPSLA